MEIFDDAENVLAVFIGSSCNEWIFDFGCTFHIYPNRSWFDTCKVVNGVVLLKDNKWLFVVNVDTIQIRMCNGIVRTLKVQHVLEMKKNLISLSVIDF